MPWAIIIIGIFLSVAAIYGAPIMITGTSSTDTIARNAISFTVPFAVVAIIVIAIFGRRH